VSDELTYDRVMSRLQSSNRIRQLYRLAFESVIDSDDNVFLKDYFFTITSQRTDYSIDIFKKDIRYINKRLNQKLVHKRKYKKSLNRIVFYCFFEQSKDKLLTHTHILLRVPIKYKDKTDEIASVIRKYLPHKFELEVRNKDYSIEYSTKHYSDYNDNFDVY
jgi:uncharacterized Fe-S radical SAM superfamily protein PflX